MQFSIEHDLTIYNDNKQTIRFLTSKIPRIETKLRHIDITQCWLRESVQNDQIKIGYIPIV